MTSIAIGKALEDLETLCENTLTSAEAEAFEHLKLYDDLVDPKTGRTDSDRTRTEELTPALTRYGKLVQSLATLGGQKIAENKKRVFAVGCVRPTKGQNCQLIIASNDPVQPADIDFFGTLRAKLLEIRDCREKTLLIDSEAISSLPSSKLSERATIKLTPQAPERSTVKKLKSVEMAAVESIVEVVSRRSAKYILDRLGKASTVIADNSELIIGTEALTFRAAVVERIDPIRAVRDGEALIYRATVDAYRAAVDELKDPIQALQGMVARYIEDDFPSDQAFAIWCQIGELYRLKGCKTLIGLRKRGQSDDAIARRIETFEKSFLVYRAVGRLLHMARSRSVLPGIELHYVNTGKRIVIPGAKQRVIHCETKVGWLLKRLSTEFPESIVPKIGCSKRPCLYCVLILAAIWPEARFTRSSHKRHFHGTIFPPLTDVEARILGAKLKHELELTKQFRGRAMSEASQTGSESGLSSVSSDHEYFARWTGRISPAIIEDVNESEE